MTKDKLKLKLSARNVMIAIFVVSFILSAGFVVKAFQSSEAPKVVSENGTVNFYEAQNPTPAPIVQEETLGAATNDARGGDLRCQNGDCTYYIQAPFNTGTTTLNGNLTVVSIPDPFLMTSSTYNKVKGVVLKTNGQTGQGYQAWYGATSTVELVRITIADKTTLAPSTTWEMDCSASADGYSTTSRKIIDTDARVPTSTLQTIESGMSSTTAYGTARVGSMVYDTALTYGGYIGITKIFLTPDYPYLVCNIWQPYGDPLDTFFGTWNTSSTQRAVNVRISRQQL